jgi:di/tricarboxylate transporter
MELLPGSLANIIALRMAGDRRIWWRFHLYSIPMLLSSRMVEGTLLITCDRPMAVSHSPPPESVPTPLSTVPPSILLAWAVNVGGFGLLPGSLANIIALRMAGDRRAAWEWSRDGNATRSADRLPCAAR